MGKIVSKEEKNWYRDQKHKTKVMYAKCTKYETAFFGNNECGKTTLIRRLTHDEFLPEYEETIITQIGVKLLDFKDRLDFPMYIRMFDTPGNAVSHLKDEQSVFENLDFAFVVLDGSKVIHKEHVIAVNHYVIQRLRTYNQKVIEKEKVDMKYKEYLCALIDEEPDNSGNLISPDNVQDRPVQRSYREHLNVDEEEDDNNSYLNPHSMHSEMREGLSQHTIMNLRQDTYKSIHSARNRTNDKNRNDDVDIMNIYRKKQIKPAMFPAVFHIITKKDMLSDQGLEDQMNRARALKADGIIDQFFFVSPKDVNEESGIPEFLEGINDRRLDLMRQQQEEKDSVRQMSHASVIE